MNQETTRAQETFRQAWRVFLEAGMAVNMAWLSRDIDPSGEPVISNESYRRYFTMSFDEWIQGLTLEIFPDESDNFFDDCKVECRYCGEPCDAGVCDRCERNYASKFMRDVPQFHTIEEEEAGPLPAEDGGGLDHDAYLAGLKAHLRAGGYLD